MKAIAGISSKHMALLDEYRMALSLWSETRAIYSPEAAEIAQATKHGLWVCVRLLYCCSRSDRQAKSTAAHCACPLG